MVGKIFDSFHIIIKPYPVHLPITRPHGPMIFVYTVIPTSSTQEFRPVPEEDTLTCGINYKILHIYFNVIVA